MTTANSDMVHLLLPERGRLFVVSGPSGVGKDSVLSAFLESDTCPSNIGRCITATTRAPRVGEIPNLDYYFLARADFEAKQGQGFFLESASYNGEYYGTPKNSVEEKRAQGEDIILKIEVQGALQIKKAVPDAILVFLAPPSWDELERRLRGRKTDKEDEVARRLGIARAEMEAATHYDYVIINDRLATAAAMLRNIVLAERCRIAKPATK